MSRLRVVAFAGLVLTVLLASIGHAVADEWVEVTSPHFRVVTDEGTRPARKLALDLERIREVIHRALPQAAADPLRPVVVIAVEGDDDLTDLFPQFRNGPTPGGVFRPGRHLHHIVLRTEAGREAIYHEYFHLLTGLSAVQLPLWLVEGLAEFHAQVDFSGRAIKLGQPDGLSLRYLRSRSDLLPMRDFLGRTTNPHLDDPGDVRVFYAQAWALTHLLVIGYDPPNVGQQALTSYMQSVGEGTDPVTAFERTVGPVNDYEDRLRQYTRQVRYREFRIELGEEIDEDSFGTRELSEAESLAVRANVLTGGVEPEAALSLLERAEGLGDDLAPVAEAMGLYHLRQGNQEDADTWFDEAIRRKTTRHIAYYERGLSSTDDETRRELFQHAIARNDRFAPAYIALARLHYDAADYQRAFAMARPAVLLDARNPSGWSVLAAASLQSGDIDQARLAAQRAMALTDDPTARARFAELLQMVDAVEKSSTEAPMPQRPASEPGPVPAVPPQGQEAADR